MKDKRVGYMPLREISNIISQKKKKGKGSRAWKDV